MGDHLQLVWPEPVVPVQSLSDSGLSHIPERYITHPSDRPSDIPHIMSNNLGLNEDSLHDAFGGDDIGACLRVNFYPKCLQPDLTLGLSSHSDPGGIILLLPNSNVAGLQVRRGHDWITIMPATHAFIVNTGDQIQILSNGIYKSVEHRVIVNSSDERISLAFFYNTRANIPIGPVKELVTYERPALYDRMTFNEYRKWIRLRSSKGRS